MFYFYFYFETINFTLSEHDINQRFLGLEICALESGPFEFDVEFPIHILIFFSAWQECYDENSGYVYYWNMETNAVTWEMPPEYQAYIANTTAMQAQHWMMEQPMGMVPVMPAHHQMMSHAAMRKHE
jgi:hypothetical protein